MENIKNSLLYLLIFVIVSLLFLGMFIYSFGASDSILVESNYVSKYGMIYVFVFQLIMAMLLWISLVNSAQYENKKSKVLKGAGVILVIYLIDIFIDDKIFELYTIFDNSSIPISVSLMGIVGFVFKRVFWKKDIKIGSIIVYLICIFVLTIAIHRGFIKYQENLVEMQMDIGNSAKSKNDSVDLYVVAKETKNVYGTFLNINIIATSINLLVIALEVSRNIKETKNIFVIVISIIIIIINTIIGVYICNMINKDFKSKQRLYEESYAILEKNASTPMKMKNFYSQNINLDGKEDSYLFFKRELDVMETEYTNIASALAKTTKNTTVDVNAYKYIHYGSIIPNLALIEVNKNISIGYIIGTFIIIITVGYRKIKDNKMIGN